MFGELIFRDTIVGMGLKEEAQYICIIYILLIQVSEGYRIERIAELTESTDSSTAINSQ